MFIKPEKCQIRDYSKLYDLNVIIDLVIQAMPIVFIIYDKKATLKMEFN